MLINKRGKQKTKPSFLEAPRIYNFEKALIKSSCSKDIVSKTEKFVWQLYAW